MMRKTFNGIYALALLIAMIGALQIAAPQAHAASSEAYNWQSVELGAGGGFVPGIIFNESEPNLIYARTDIGGAYRWEQSTGSWIPLTDSVGWDDWNKNGVDALATDPVDPDRVYMATGTYTNDWDTNGQIMRSTDRGDTWQVTSLPFKVGGNMPGRSMGERLMVDPNKNSILFYGARSGNGLWKSTDYGVTWTHVTSFPNPGTYIQNPGQEYGSDVVGLAWITFDPQTGSSGNATQTIYVGVADTGNSVYRSTDGGSTWAAVSGQPTGYLPHHGVLSSTGNLYITYSDGVGPYDGAKGEVWKLNTSTGVWTEISPVASSSDDDYFGYGGLAVDAQHPDTLMVATLNSWWPDAIIFRSADGGANWTRIWDWNGYPGRTLRYTQDISAAPWLNFGVTGVPPVPSPKLGWMIGDLEIDPFNSDRMMYGTGATIYGTNNLTDWDAGTVTISVMAKGMSETAVLGLISPPSGSSHLISALGDISGFRHEDLTQAPSQYQTSPTYASTQSFDYAELNPGFMVRVGQADKSADANMKSIGLSYDGGGNWYMPNSEPSNGTTTVGNGQVAVSADGSSIVWSTGDIGVYYTGSGGNSWTASTGVPAGAKVLSDRVNPDKFYAFSQGHFYISTNGGASFTQTAATALPTNVVPGALPNENSISIKAMPGIEGDIWFAGGNSSEGKYGVWHSTDSGTTFTPLSTVEEADLIGFGKAAPGQTYMALYIVGQVDGTRGVFRSDNQGATWVRINDDQHQYARINMALTGDPRIYGRVYLGTNGRGILYADPAGTSSNSSITPTTANFDKKTANQADVAVTITWNGNTLSGIKNGSATLVSGTDYTVSGNTATIRKGYLAGQAVGTTNLTFDFSSGVDPTLAVTIVDTTSSSSNSSITPTSANFDKKTANQADVAVTITWNGNTLSGIKNGSATLVSGTDYTVSGNTATIRKGYLAGQAVGTTNLTFDFSSGVDPTLAITIVDTTSSSSNSSITPTTANFDKKTANQADVAVTMTLNGNTLSGIKNGSATLVSGTDYTVSGNTATIRKGYLAGQAVGTTNLTFDFSSGVDPTLAITIVDTTSSSQNGSFKIQMYNGNTTATINTLNPRYKITNTGTSAIPLTDLTLRYYYTIDSAKPQSFWCDWSHVGSSNVTGNFVTMGTPKTNADTYLEIGFTSGAGSLGVGQSIEIQTRINKNDWTNYTQTNDYSFDSTDSSYVDWNNVPGYLSGSLEWGNEP